MSGNQAVEDHGKHWRNCTAKDLKYGITKWQAVSVTVDCRRQESMEVVGGSSLKPAL